MATTITPTNYGIVSYGLVSYEAHFSSQSAVIVVTPPLILEALVSVLIPADVKVYFSVQD